MRPTLAWLILSLLSAACPAGAQSLAPAAQRVINVPYLPQTDALCGGAALAMVFRYWGERHVAVHEFAGLVDADAKGIADDVLVEAVRERGWEAVRLDADVGVLRDQVAADHPIILLIQDRPGRYHFVVVVGADAGHIVVHHPARGPSRPYTPSALARVWRQSKFWALLVLPGQSAVSSRQSAVSSPRADSLGEQAGIRFADERWHEAAALAARAAASDPSDGYAWDVLGSSRFIEDDLAGALRAWNHVNKPRLDSVRIQGLTRTRYALVADTLRLTPDALLTEGAFRLAERRVQQLPDQLSSRLAYRPDADGYATIDVAITERPSRPRGTAEWTATAAKTLVDREITATVPAGSQGALWTAGWRWWSRRPRVAIGFAAPHVGRLPGVWRVDASWNTQTYRTRPGLIEEEQIHGGIAVGDWLTPKLRYELSAGGDSWTEGRRAIFLGGTIEHRLLNDRVSLAASVREWLPAGQGNRFFAGSVHAGLRSSNQLAGFVGRLDAAVEVADDRTPLSIWPGAGEGLARTPLLRAHPLLDGGVIDVARLGRHLSWLTVEEQRWYRRPVPAPLGVAVFADLAHASARLAGSAGDGVDVDLGVGLRLRMPGSEGALRIDYARGLRDGSHALTVGWQN